MSLAASLGRPERTASRHYVPRALQARRLSRAVFYLVLAGLAIYAIAPLVVVLFAALKSEQELAANPLGFPHHVLWSNFSAAWSQGNIGTGMRNSAILAGGTIVGVCIIAGLAAYAMARLDLPGGNGVIIYLVGVSALPIQLFLVPLFYLWSHLRLYNSLPGVIIIYCALFSPFATLLLRSFMVSLPRDYEEAARIDGASELRVLWRVTLRLVAPGFLTVALIAGLSAWNEFLIGITFLQSTNLQPVSVALYSFQQGYSQNDSLISAAGIIMLLPMLGLFLALQRHFIAGIATGGLGGD
ncbi:MAG TPA: carbohydrate ABC transporter permease [Streptosporangiaceae bacterium]|nr:carbohydrate ABC transporter permease [Streptosporangiaceae bacterium]